MKLFQGWIFLDQGLGSHFDTILLQGVCTEPSISIALSESQEINDAHPLSPACCLLNPAIRATASSPGVGMLWCWLGHVKIKTYLQTL